MSAKEQIIDFIHSIVIVFTISYLILFFIVGDRFIIFIELLRSLIPLAYFVVLFLLILKFERFRFKSQLNRLTLYLNYFDKLYSYILIIALPVLMILVALFSGENLEKSDILISLVALILLLLWRNIIFKYYKIEKKDDKEYEIIVYLSRLAIIKSKVIIFLLPIIILILIFSIEKTIGKIEALQASIIFLLLYAWEKYLFRKV